MSETINLSVIIPAYNEENAISGTLKDVFEYLAKRAFKHEIIVVDDGSTDKTVEYAWKCASMFNKFKILKNPCNKGKGYAVRSGVLSAQEEYILFMDADNSTSIYEFDKFIPYLKDGYDVVISSRRMEGSIVDEPQPFIRANMGKFYIFLTQALLGLDVSDLNCGFKVYRAKSTRCIFETQKMDDWSFDAELLFLANKNNLKLKEVPVRWVHKSGSKVNPVKDAVKSFVSILKIKINNWIGKYR